MKGEGKKEKNTSIFNNFISKNRKNKLLYLRVTTVEASQVIINDSHSTSIAWHGNYMHHECTSSGGDDRNRDDMVKETAEEPNDFQTAYVSM